MGDMSWMMGPAWMFSGWLSLLFGPALLVLVVIAVVAGVAWLSKAVASAPGSGRSDPALEILRERYARGEISRDEFERMRQDLS